MFSMIKRWFTGSNDAEIKKLVPTVNKINALEPGMQALSDEALRELTETFRRRVRGGETLDELLPEAFAAAREACRRAVGKRHFDVQLMGGMVLHQGRIAEMKTGEGKTITVALPAYLNALSGKGVHVVTVNDYLVSFQGEEMSKVFAALGMTTGRIVHDMSAAERQAAYACDVTYATNNELGFDYLRDNMVVRKEQRVLRPLHYAVVDEVDSILIDEARTPLIISGHGDKSTDLYDRANGFVGRLREEDDYTRDEKKKTVNLTEEGADKTEKFFGIENLSDIENTEIQHHVLAALRAHVLMKRDVDYVVQNNEVVIVDEFTGRLMVGRRYSDGLHQAIEAKERVRVQRESKTLATITFQNYFRMYEKLSGMTGTAKTEEDEFRGIYKLDVVQVPTYRPMIRKDHNDAVYTTERGKFMAVVDEIVRLHAKQQPVLVGTVSVEKSERLSDMLKERGVVHEVLNAKNHQKEAEIVAQAGKAGAVTIATNMAGRGTDILLGGNPEFMARRAMRQRGFEEEAIETAVGHADPKTPEEAEARAAFRELYAEFKKETDKAHDEVVTLGGLVILGTERHESRRIDNQLRGRAGRLGDPGESRFYISLEDDLMRLFGSDRVRPMIEKMGVAENEPIEYGILSKQIENAQKRVESRNYEIRKHVLQFDDVMNKQRELIYGQRGQVLEGKDLHPTILQMLEELIKGSVSLYCPAQDKAWDWDLEGLWTHLNATVLPKGTISYTREEQEELTREKIAADIMPHCLARMAEIEKQASDAGLDMRELERAVLLRNVDVKWMDHIDAMDQLREGISLRAYGQRDPVVEYRLEGFEMFDAMIESIRADTLSMLFHLRIEKAPEREQVAKPMEAGEDSRTPVRKQKPTDRVGRNDPCPCGSGKKFKQCCGRDA